MKHLFRVIIFQTMYLLLIACGQSVIATVSPPPTLTTIATVTAAQGQIPAIPIKSTPTPFDVLSDSLPTLSLPNDPSNPLPTPASIPPTLLPTIDPKLAPALLNEAISIQTHDGVNEHSIKQITGWAYGFQQRPCNSYQWLDSNHLFLYPRTGEWINIYRDGGGREDVISQTIVINLETGITWLPPYQSSREGRCDSPQWSLEHGLMVFPTVEPGFQSQQEAVSVFTLDGGISKTYWGKLIDVSPSGTKILIDDDTWIDLISGEVVDFAWYKYKDSAPDEFVYVSPPIWSSDETQVLICCYFYGNARTGKTYDWKDYNAYGGTWVKNTSYLLLQYHSYWGVDPGFIPLYDPATNTTLNLNKLAKLPADLQCPETSASPNGEYVWVMCYGIDYLVNLSNFESKGYPGYTQVDISWSVDGKFAWIDNFDRAGDSGLKVLSVTSQKLLPFPVNPGYQYPSWHPKDNVLAYLAENNQSLVLLNVKDMTVQGWKLPTSVSGFHWSPNGERLVFISTNGSLWQVDYPEFQNFEQLTEPTPDVNDVFWSPDGNSIAFVSGSDIYIVETTK